MRWSRRLHHSPFSPTSPNLAESQSKELQATARKRGLQLHLLRASTDQGFDDAFASIVQSGASGLVISSDSFFFSRSAQLARLAIRQPSPRFSGFVSSSRLAASWRMVAVLRNHFVGLVFIRVALLRANNWLIYLFSNLQRLSY